MIEMPQSTSLHVHKLVWRWVPAQTRGAGAARRSTGKRKLTRKDRQQLSALLDMITSATSDDGSGRNICEEFQKLPSRDMYPDYYILVKRPIALANMRAKLATKQYLSVHDLAQDLRLMCDNARQYRLPGS